MRLFVGPFFIIRLLSTKTTSSLAVVMERWGLGGVTEQNIVNSHVEDGEFSL